MPPVPIPVDVMSPQPSGSFHKRPYGSLSTDYKESETTLTFFEVSHNSIYIHICSPVCALT